MRAKEMEIAAAGSPRPLERNNRLPRQKIPFSPTRFSGV
jgi:hypothetical protein